jgi:hypothetical protein
MDALLFPIPRVLPIVFHRYEDGRDDGYCIFKWVKEMGGPMGPHPTKNAFDEKVLVGVRQASPASNDFYIPFLRRAHANKVS